MSPAPDLEQLVRGGAAIVVGTRDARLRPALGRAWGPRLSEDGERLTICVEASAGSATRAHLAEDDAPIAVTIVSPSTYSSVQVKGRVTAVREPGDDDLRRMAAHEDAFVAETATLGLAEEVARGLQDAEFLVVDVALAERFDQTPGPGAGGRL